MQLSSAITISISAFSLGTICDFLISNFREDIWLWTRVRLWDRINNIRISELHFKVAGALFRIANPPDKDNTKREIFVVIIAALWCTFAAFIGNNIQETVLSEDTFHASLFLASSAILLFLIYTVWDSIPEKKIKRIVPVWVFRIYEFIIYSTLGGFIFLVFFPFALLFYPPSPGWGAALLSVLLNASADYYSYKISMRLLKWISGGTTVSGVLAPPIDIISALILSVASVFIISAAHVVYFYPNGPVQDNAFYVLLMSISALVPTLIIGVSVFSLTVLKISQISAREFSKFVINLSASPYDEHHVRPFSMIGACIAFATWSALGIGHFLQFLIPSS